MDMRQSSFLICPLFMDHSRKYDVREGLAVLPSDAWLTLRTHLSAGTGEEEERESISSFMPVDAGLCWGAAQSVAWQISEEQDMLLRG